MTFKRLFFSLGALALALAAAPGAQAQTCKTTADCHQGFVCVANVTTDPGPGKPTPTPAPDAPKTGALVAPQGGSCQPAPCAADSECGPNMICYTQTIGACSGGAAAAPCPPNTDCAPTKVAPPPTCTETKVSTCTFVWQLPCSTDTDCGAGFMCTPTVSTSCSGSGGGTAGSGASTGGTPSSAGAGTAPSGGAAVPAADLVAPAPPRDCTTTTTFPGYCEPKAKTCAANTDCPTDWTCSPGYSRDTPVSGTGAAGTSGTTSVDRGATGAAGTAGATTASDANIAQPGAGVSAPDAPTTMVCTSPYSSYGAGLPRTAEDASGGSTTTAGGTGAAGTGALPPQSPGPVPTTAPAGQNSGAPSAGCAVGGTGGSSAALAAFALLGLAFARRRRG